MQEAGVSIQPTLFELLAKINKAETGIKAGSYSINQGITPSGADRKITPGQGQPWTNCTDRRLDLASVAGQA